MGRRELRRFTGSVRGVYLHKKTRVAELRYSQVNSELVAGTMLGRWGQKQKAHDPVAREE